MTGLAIAIARLREAKSPLEVFGQLSTLAELRVKHRSLARALHPDRHGGSEMASEAMALLNGFYERGEKQLENGTWGKPAGATIVARNTYSAVVAFAAGDVSDVYLGEYGDVHRNAIIKIARDARDRDLLANEATVLSALWKPADEEAKCFQRYLPRLIEQTSIKAAGGDHAVNVFEFVPGGLTLTELVARVGGRLDPRHVAWIWKRLLECLDWVHRQGIVHGGITPDHVLVFPKTHGVQLLDWSYAIKGGGKLKAISKPHRGYYPAEIFSKKPYTTGADLHMVAKCVIAMLGADPAALALPVAASTEYAGMVNACLLAPGRRFENAFELYQVLEKRLRSLFGPPKFIPLDV